MHLTPPHSRRQVSNLSNSVADLMRQQANANAEAAKQEALLQVGRGFTSLRLSEGAGERGLGGEEGRSVGR